MMTHHRLNQEMATRSPHIKPIQATRLSTLSALSGPHISSMPTLGTQLRSNHPYKYDGCAIRSQQEPTNRNPKEPKAPKMSGTPSIRHPFPAPSRSIEASPPASIRPISARPTPCPPPPPVMAAVPLTTIFRNSMKGFFPCPRTSPDYTRTFMRRRSAFRLAVARGCARLIRRVRLVRLPFGRRR